MRFLSVYRRFNDYLEMAIFALAVAFMLFICLAIFTAATTRYLTGVGYDWLAELPPQLLPWVVFPLMGVLLRHSQHLSVDVISHIVSRRGMIVVQLLVAAVCLATSILFLFAGIEAVGFFRMLNQQSTTEIVFPLWWLYLAFPAGFLLVANFSLELILVQIVRLLGREHGAGMRGSAES